MSKSAVVIRESSGTTSDRRTNEKYPTVGNQIVHKCSVFLHFSRATLFV
jgi:hypothetical protein